MKSIDSWRNKKKIKKDLTNVHPNGILIITKDKINIYKE